MSSRSKNFRRRAEEDEDDINGEDTPSQQPNGTKPKKPPSQRPQSHPQRNRPNNQAPKLLSFAADEEEDDNNDAPTTTTAHRRRDRDRPSSRPSRPSSSLSGFPSSASHQHKITPAKDRQVLSLTVAPTPSNVQPQAGEYTKEKLLELQKNTRTLAASSKPSSTKPAEPVVVLKGLLKPSSPPKPFPSLGDSGVVEEEEEAAAAAEAVVLENRRRNLERDKDDAESRLATMGLGKSSKDALIPDQATINAIRAKRERLRKSRAPDYISLDGGSNQQGLSDDEPEFEGRIALLGEKTDGAAKGVFESFDGGRAVAEARPRVDEDDEDEEDNIWEEEQFRKGLGKRVDDGANRGGHSIPTVQAIQQQPSIVYPGNAYQAASVVSSTATVGVTRSAEVMSISQQAEVARRALQGSVMRLKETHGRTMSSIARTDESLSASVLNITVLEKSLSAANEKFIFMQKLRDFVSVICDFLQDKAPYIEELEEQMQKLHEERASAITERRAADIADEMTGLEAAVEAATSVFDKGGGTTAVAAAAQAAQAAFSMAREQSNLPVQKDEFGRDLNLQKRMDLDRRSEARKRRRARSESKRLSSTRDDSAYRVEGESTTDESETESSAYQSNRDVLLQTAEQVFSDAAEEYSKLAIVKEKFEKWKKNYSPSYRDAYISLSVPAIFSPYVRLELLNWDPLYEDRDFNGMKWYSLLFNYGLADDGTYESDDRDAELIPQLVEKVALPILHHEIAHCWDILSTRETKNAVSAMKLVLTYVPASSEALRELLVAIHNRLADAVADFSVPNWSNLVIKAVPNAARIAAYRFGMSVRLLKSICYWKDILALPLLEELAFDKLVSQKVLPHIRSVTPNIHDAVTRTERVVVALSGVWSGPSVTGGNSKKLQLLVEHIMILGKSLEKRHSSGVNSEFEISGLARRLKKMLVELNEYDKARAVLRTFQLKEAL